MGEREKQYKGSVSYAKLWELLQSQGKNKKWLRDAPNNLSPTIIKRLTDNTNVAVDTIMFLCEILHCQPSDIMEYKEPESK